MKLLHDRENKCLHVFIEKPLALCMDDIDRLMSSARQAKQKVMVGFNQRWHRLARAAKRIIQRGLLGNIEAVQTFHATIPRYNGDPPEWRKRRQMGGGVLVEMAVHHFDNLQFFPIKGFSGSLSYRIRGMANTLTTLPFALATVLRGGNSMGTYRSEWRHFVDCIINDKPVECTLEDGKRALQLAIVCTESSSTQQPVKVHKDSGLITVRVRYYHASPDRDYPPSAVFLGLCQR